MRICDWVERNLISHRGTDCSYLPFPKQEGIHTQRELGYKLGRFFLLFPGHSLLIGFDCLDNKWDRRVTWLPWTSKTHSSVQLLPWKSPHCYVWSGEKRCRLKERWHYSTSLISLLTENYCETEYISVRVRIGNIPYINTIFLSDTLLIANTLVTRIKDCSWMVHILDSYVFAYTLPGQARKVIIFWWTQHSFVLLGYMTSITQFLDIFTFLIAQCC